MTTRGRKVVRKRTPWRLIGALTLLICFGAIGWFVFRPDPLLTACQQKIPLEKYPPMLDFQPQQGELEAWLQGYQGDDAGEHLKWIGNMLASSSSPIGRSAGDFLIKYQADIEFSARPLDGPTLAVVQPSASGEKIDFIANVNLLQGSKKWASIDIGIGFVHEVQHAKEYIIMAEQMMKEKGISRKEAYKILYDISATNEASHRCGELQAMGAQVAYYAELNKMGYKDTVSFHEEYLKKLKELSWQWASREWADYMNEQLGY